MRKRIFAGMLLMALSVIISGCATGRQYRVDGPRYVDVVPYMDGEEMVIPNLPPGAELISIFVYDDRRGIPPRNVGSRQRTPLLPGAGFNFQWRNTTDLEVHWQMITPQSEVGPGLAVDCGNGGCKYVRP